MPWGRVDDSLYDHPKLDELPGTNRWPDRLAGVGLNYLAVSWCNRHLTDGRIPARQVERLGGNKELADLLVKARFWDRDRGGGYRIHDFLEYNDSKAEVLARREKEAARKAAWRARSPGRSPAGTDAGTEDLSRVESQGVSRDSPRARIPTRPGPARPGPTESRETHPARPRAGGKGRTNGTAGEAEKYDALEQRDAPDDAELVEGTKHL